MRLARKRAGWSLLTLCVLIGACIGPPLLISPQELPNAVEGKTYGEFLSTDSGQSLSWQLGQGTLPPGLVLFTDTGRIVGVPTATGTFDFFVLAVDAGVPPRTGQKWYSITVLEKLTLDFPLPQARVGQPFEATPTISGGVLPYSVTIAGLPAGLDHDSSTGRIFGTPLNDYKGLRLEVIVTDSGTPQQTAVKRPTLVIRPIAVSIVTTTLAAASIGENYSVTLEAANGRPPYLWTVSAGVLPNGLRLDRASGVISGNPAAGATTQTFTISVSDDDTPPPTASRDFTIEVQP